MRNLNLLDVYRQTDNHTRHVFGTVGDDTCGVFIIPSQIDGQPLVVIASSGHGWDHCSVSRKNRCPNWPEMSQIKQMFFMDHEVVVQYHVPEKDHVNFHPNCLHLFRPIDQPLPRPPSWMVGPKSGQTVEECRAEADADMSHAERTVFAEDKG